MPKKFRLLKSKLFNNNISFISSMVEKRCNLIIDICYELYLEDTIAHSKEGYYQLVCDRLKEKEKENN